MRDVTILGGGLAGLSLALQLKQNRPALGICVVERSVFPVPEATHKVGESTVELATHYFSQVLGLKDHLQTQQLPKFGLRFFFGCGKIESRLEVGGSDLPPTPSYQLDRGRFENFLAKRCRQAGVEVIDDAVVEEFDLSTDADTLHSVTYNSAGKKTTIQSKWLVDASGRAALLKKSLDLKKPSEHRASSAWFRVGEPIRVDDWSKEPEWTAGHTGRTARWYSTNHLMGTGYWVWLIPLASGSTSVGVVVDQTLHPIQNLSTPEKTLEWLKLHEPQCAEKIRPEKIRDFGVLKNYSHDCRRVFSSKRWFLTGEAGVFPDPFYSPGSDFIALSNGFITNLILAQENGEDIRSKTRFFNNLYLSFFRNTLQIFQGQYPIFGHPQVMPLKLVWDQATYWALLAFLYFQKSLNDPADVAALGEPISQIGAANQIMQRAFRQAAQTLPERPVSGRIDFLSVKLLLELNRNLAAPHDVQQTLKKNANRLRSLASEMLLAFGLTDSDYSNVQPSEELTDFIRKIGLDSKAERVPR